MYRQPSEDVALPARHRLQQLIVTIADRDDNFSDLLSTVILPTRSFYDSWTWPCLNRHLLYSLAYYLQSFRRLTAAITDNTTALLFWSHMLRRSPRKFPALLSAASSSQVITPPSPHHAYACCCCCAVVLHGAPSAFDRRDKFCFANSF